MDTPLVKRAYNLGLKAVPNFVALSEEQISFYEKNLDKLQEAILRGFIITLDFIIHVDRSIKPSYPDWVKRVVHPEFEFSGPSDYNLRDNVELWLYENNGLYENQKTRNNQPGQKIYEYQKDNNLLENCLNLQDLISIQEKGSELFKELFRGKSVFAWKSVVLSNDFVRYVPYLFFNPTVEVVELGWRKLGFGWGRDQPALHFCKIPYLSLALSSY